MAGLACLQGKEQGYTSDGQMRTEQKDAGQTLRGLLDFPKWGGTICTIVKDKDSLWFQNRATTLVPARPVGALLLDDACSASKRTVWNVDAGAGNSIIRRLQTVIILTLGLQRRLFAQPGNSESVGD